MGKAILLLLSAFTVMGVYYAFDRNEGLQATSQRVATHQYEVLARNAAQAGYQAARMALARQFGSQTLEGAYDAGSYKATATVGGGVARIVSEGRIPRRNGSDAVVTIVAEVRRNIEATIAEEPPLFMSYALLTQNDLSLNGNLLGDILVQGDQRATLNANMHTNASLYIDGSSVLVKGFGTYVQSASANPAKALQGSFQPNYNPTESASARKAQVVSIPAYDAAGYTSRVVVDTTTAGDVTLGGSYAPGGTRQDPYIWHVKGNLRVASNTTIDGYALFIVDGGIVFERDVLAGRTGHAGADESSLAFYAGNTIDFGGNTKVYAQLFAGGSAIFQKGTPHIFGSITTRGAADLRGTPKIYYRRASSALTTIWQNAEEARLQLISYSEW